MAGGPAGRAYAPQDSLPYFTFSAALPLSLTSAVVDCDAGFRPPPAGGGPGPSGTTTGRVERAATGRACVPSRLLDAFSSASAARPGRRQGRQGFDEDRHPVAAQGRHVGLQAGRGRQAGPGSHGLQGKGEGHGGAAGCPGYSGLTRRPGRGWGLGRKLLGGPRLHPHQLPAKLGHQRVPLLFASLRTVV